MANGNKARLLIVDDERNTRTVLERLLQLNYDITLAEDGITGLNLLQRHDYDVVLTDLKMPGAGGMAVLEVCRGKTPIVPCILMTAYGTQEKAFEIAKAGAFDFVTKPLKLERVELLLERAVESKRLKEENRSLKRRLKRSFGTGGIIGKSSVMRELLETVEQIAPSRSTVLITGESGTGKELVAQSLHQLSGRSGRFVPVHCAALPENLLESELFGHEKGAFSGAVEQRKGRFELADGGTLFLDEIGEIALSVQVKLLRALESRIIERVGGVEPIDIDTRVVTATNRDLRAMVKEGTFREDLFYRLDVVAVNISPLRERQEDIPLLIKHFIDELAAENGKDILTVSEDVVSVLSSYAWPGNIRELRNCVERMIVMSRDEVLHLENIPVNIREASMSGIDKSIFSSSNLDLDQHEKHLILKALDDCGGNRTKAAGKLGISRRTLHRKLNLYNIQ